MNVTFKFPLGIKVQDKISGFTGITGARIQYINGCIRYEVVPWVDKDGNHVESRFYDEGRVEIVEPEEEKVEVEKKTTGGHQEDPPRS